MNSRAKGGQVIERSNQITWYLSTATNLKFWRRLFPVPEMQLVVGGDDEKLLDGVEGEAGNDALHTPHLRPTIQVPDPHLPAQTAACYHSLVYIDWWFSTKKQRQIHGNGYRFLKITVSDYIFHKGKIILLLWWKKKLVFPYLIWGHTNL